MRNILKKHLSLILILILVGLNTSVSGQAKTDSNRITNREGETAWLNREARMSNADPGIRYMAMQETEIIPVQGTITRLTNLYLPAGYNSNKKYSFLFLAYTANQEKVEKVVEVHAQKLASAGYIVFPVNASSGIESGKDLSNDPAAWIEYLRKSPAYHGIDSLMGKSIQERIIFVLPSGFSALN